MANLYNIVNMNCKKNIYMLIFNMCILFFNSKIKLDKLTDIMTTKVNKNIKLDTKISVPNGYIALVYYKDHYLYTLETGEYKLDIKQFEKLINKNSKRNKKKKKPTLNFNLHYITKKELNISFDFKAITSIKEKSKYSLNACYTISNPKVFAKELLITWYKTTNSRTISYIHSWFKDLSEYILRKYTKLTLSNNENLKEFSNKYFKKYGITLNSINLSSNKTIFFEPINTQKIEEKQSIDNTFNTAPKKSNDTYCPKCQAKLIQGSVFCVRCGQKINVRDYHLNKD